MPDTIMPGDGIPSPADYPPVIPRARLGFIIPSSNRMVEPQMQRFAPKGVQRFELFYLSGRSRARIDSGMRHSGQSYENRITAYS